MQSGRSAISRSASLVVVTPIGPIPVSSPASRPTLLAECTHTPTNSVPGFSATARTAMDPMPPVDQTTTRNGLSAMRGCRLQFGGKGFQAGGVRPHSPCHRFAVELVGQ